MGILEKIADIEREISRTQKNKATEYHLGLLKAKLARYRAELLEPKGTSSKPGEGFDVMKSGDARVVMIGFPSVGKSTLLNKLTNTHSEANAYEFTTLTCIPGKVQYNGANIQLLDLPGIIQGASEGKGRGRQVIAVARTADLVLMMLDTTKSDVQRLNKRKPNIYIKQKKGGGFHFNATVKLTHLSEKLVYQILHDYKIFNVEVLIREDATVDEFIDVLVGNRKYVPCLYCHNKIDQITIEEVDALARSPNSTVISSELEWNLDGLLDKIWEMLSLNRIYTKRRGEYPDFSGGLIVRRGATIEHVCHTIHRSLADEFKYALVWGTSTKHNPQKVGISHSVDDEDVIQIVKKL
ncbi:developmentally-regulated GTP-binding protein 2-like protein [Rozella allomycis CSF55]|uniref:Developmentally-regulated GTP-binding protein 2-like protein n=1 Tax=Rozella allomycis (strain CSF55) TaxID=988480 RepID=A0A4P9YJW8_ROZAC|nr:developmentally-regulated GTP-binding protein 2-like protein [Rozella allomycis CSF55]